MRFAVAVANCLLIDQNPFVAVTSGTKCVDHAVAANQTNATGGAVVLDLHAVILPLLTADETTSGCEVMLAVLIE